MEGKYMNAPGKSLLKVCGILMIIFAAIALVVVVIGFIGYSVMDNPEVKQAMEQAALQTGTAVASKSDTLISLLISTLAVVLEMAAGILGIRNCNRPDKAQSCFIMGVIIIGYQLANAIYATIAGSFSIITTIIGLILPVLYVWGALKNKQVSQQNEF